MDWIDPNTWKLPAELIGHWQAILAGLVLFGDYVTGFFRWVLKLLGSFQSHTKSNIRQKGISISFVPNDFRCNWGEAKLDGQSGTHINGHWHVKNSSESDVMILKARFSRYATRFVQIATRHPEDERLIFGNYPVQSHQMSELSADFTFFPPIARAPKPIVTDVIFTDNLGNEYRARTQFSYIALTSLFDNALHNSQQLHWQIQARRQHLFQSEFVDAPIQELFSH